MKLFPIEGNTLCLDGGAMFGNAPKEMWKKWMAPDALNRLQFASRCLLVVTDSGQNILFETGVGSFFDPKMRERFAISENHALLDNLKAIGLSHQDIHAIILSHLHFDHAGGLLSAYESGPLELLFPNATFYVGKEHWLRAQQPHLREKASFIPLIHDLLKKSNRLKLLELNESPDLDIDVKFHDSNGHTIGLLLAEIQTTQDPIIFVSDIAPGLPWLHTPICMGYDRFPELIVDEKHTLFQYVLNKNATLFFTHDPKVAFAKLSLSDKYMGTEIQILSS